MTASRRPRILIPLALELAFALVVFAAIRATDGGRYGLGAKAALERLVDRYRQCETYKANIVDMAGAFPHVVPKALESRVTRQYWLLYKAPNRFAGTYNHIGGPWLFVQNGQQFRVELPPKWTSPDSTRSRVTMTTAFGFVWYPPPLAYELLLAGHDAPTLQRVRYVSVERRRGPEGRPLDVIVLEYKYERREIWVRPEGEIAAVVYRTVREPYTEVYVGTGLGAWVHDAVFNMESFDALREEVEGPR